MVARVPRNIPPRIPRGTPISGRSQRHGIPGNTITAMERPLITREVREAAKINLRSVLKRSERMIPSKLPDGRSEKIALLSDIWHSLFKDQPVFEYGNAVLFSQAMANRQLDPASSSMLLMVIANKFRLPLHLVSTPNTYHVRWQDKQDAFNFSYGTHADDESVIDQLGIPLQGIKSGAYMRNLTPIELRGAIHFRRGLFYVYQGDMAPSIMEFALSAAYWHSNPANYVNMGNSCLAQRNYMSAMENYDAALQYDPVHPEALFYKAMTYIALNDVEAAKKCYAEAVKLKPELRQRLTKGQTLLDENNFSISKIADIFRRHKGDTSRN